MCVRCTVVCLIVFITQWYKHDLFIVSNLASSNFDMLLWPLRFSFFLMDISGAMTLFKKLDVGPLQLGDYLG